MKSAPNTNDFQMGQRRILEHEINHLRKIDMIKFDPNEPTLCWALGTACTRPMESQTLLPTILFRCTKLEITNAKHVLTLFATCTIASI